jgi:tRNA(fMet)-specific endonuclease VapC
LIDSDWLIDARIGKSQAIQLINELSEQGLAISVVSRGELFNGAFALPDPEDELAQLREFLWPFTTIPLSDPILTIFGRNRFELRRSGRRIPDFDLLIGATAVHRNLTLVTRNLRHFERLPDLMMYQPE